MLKGVDVLGIDPSPRQIEQAHRICAGLEGAGRRLRCCDLADLAKEGERFHSVVMLDALEHVKDRVGLLQLVREVMDPAGRLVVCVPAIPRFFDDRDRASGHYLGYDCDALAAEAALGGFAVESTRYWNFLGWLHRHLTGAAPAEGEFEAYGFRYRDGVLARGVNALLRYYFLLVENHLPVPIGMSLFAVFVPATWGGRPTHLDEAFHYNRPIGSGRLGARVTDVAPQIACARVHKVGYSPGKHSSK
jgi:SAM-dependent methyltransferase